MENLGPYLLTAFVGLVSGILACIPVGPINVTILNEGARRGFFWAFMIGLGAMAMDLIYCSVAFAGFSSLFTSRVIRATMELFSFVLLVFLGLRYLFLHDLPATTKTVEAVEQKLHPHTAFWTGFVRVLGNPAVLLYYLTLSATFMAHRWIADTFASKAVCVASITLGGLIWFTGLSWAVSLGHRRLSTTTLLRMSRFSGILLLAMAALLAVRMIRLLAEQT